ncbi:hypothetical protein BOTBODRAFT_35428 [Botryobasidium botryosum FD-172 SS1]|uniref:histidine kinase n=1 Tax=Botryobasidium botryosum (strain FD-172 SS1) TaxID=930990 RepID=A0A067M6H8_BOTB1|nr:hypothetical protein BOTBODRAFT_35428 [Botryobasidium botryosum FD-172 SS1]
MTPAEVPSSALESIQTVAPKKADYESGLHVHWARFKKRIGHGAALSESMEVGGSTDASSFHHAAHEKRTNPDVAPSGVDDQELDMEEPEVDEVVVDTEFVTHGDNSNSTQFTPEDSGSPGRSGGSHTDRGSLARYTPAANNFWDRIPWLGRILMTVLPAVHRFFNPKFFDEDLENKFLRETWYTQKTLSLYAGLFLVLNWALACALVAQPFSIIEKIYYYGVGALLSVPVPVMIFYDLPLVHPRMYQRFITCSIWSWAIYNVIFIKTCGYYGGPAYFSCGDKDFLGLLYYATSLPAIGLFALKMNRFHALFGGFIFVCLICGLIVPQKPSWLRNVVNVVVFHPFLAYVNYMREVGERRLYTLRDQLKVQYRATQQAQVSERKAADSKRRLTSYIFHEVRIPLNTALLAVQNMQAADTVDREADIEFTALEGSLSMMSKVLNDVLDFNRMDSGRFESVSRPYPFHTVLRSVLVPLQMAADARGLQLITELDKNIDIVARRISWAAQGRSEAWIADRLAEEKDDTALVIGDEMRLRQIITNLASNACKFTPAGGTIHIRTKLIKPTLDDLPCTPKEGSRKSSLDGESSGLSMSRLKRHDTISNVASLPHERIVIRIEVEDTGVGIRQRDLVDNRLFSPYVQTEIGRFQGGKGTGLGLALVRHIVRLSGGRLGVKSKQGVGSMFWVELSPGVPLAPSKGGESPGISHSIFPERQAWTMDPAAAAFKASQAEGITPSTTADFSSPSPGYSMTSTVVDSPNLHMPASLPTQQDSALVTIMEHGGMVELHAMSARTRRDGATSGTNFPDPVVSTVAASLLSDAASASSSQPPSPPTAQSPPGPTPGSSRAPSAPPTFNTTARATLDATSSIPPQPLPATPGGTVVSSPFATPPKVLVVDDDLLTRRLMSRMLTRMGCNVETAENGQIALEMILASGPTPFFETPPVDSGESTPRITEGRFTIVFLDNQMPRLSGVEMTKRLRALGRQDFLVGVTGNALKEDQDEYYEAGVDRVLTKPVLESSLKEMLMLADERRRSRLKG